jgi:mono/diheme cytochrome c family protein
MNRASKRLSTSLIALLACLGTASCAKETQKTQPMSDVDLLKRGEYLTIVMGCGDCHTPGYFFGAPDMSRKFSGSELGWEGPWGVTYARNITPEPETGIAAWSEQDIMTAIRTGKRPDGTAILPPMPWVDFAYLSDEDALAIAKYVKSVPPVPHKVPDRVPPGTKATGSIVVFPPQPSAWDAPRVPPPAN